MHTKSAGDNRATTDKEKGKHAKGPAHVRYALEARKRYFLGEDHIRNVIIMTWSAAETCQKTLVEEAELILRHVVQWRSQALKDRILSIFGSTSHVGANTGAYERVLRVHLARVVYTHPKLSPGTEDDCKSST